MIGPEPWNSELRNNSCVCYVVTRSTSPPGKYWAPSPAFIHWKSLLEAPILGRAPSNYRRTQIMDPPKNLNLGYSLKNIPIPSPSTYTTALIKRTEDVIKRMRWKAFFFLRNDDLDSDDPESKETFGFRTRKCPPRVNELEAFEDDLLKMIENIDFRTASNDLQRRLDKDIQKIKNSKDVIVPADKTRNLYACQRRNMTSYSVRTSRRVTSRLLTRPTRRSMTKRGISPRRWRCPRGWIVWPRRRRLSPLRITR